MNKELIKLMQISTICENKVLSQMLEDIEPIKEKSFTDLEIEANKNEKFSLVLYKKENIIVKIFKCIKLGLEKLNIMKHSRNFEMEKRQS